MGTIPVTNLGPRDDTARIPQDVPCRTKPAQFPGKGKALQPDTTFSLRSAPTLTTTYDPIRTFKACFQQEPAERFLMTLDDVKKVDPQEYDWAPAGAWYAMHHAVWRMAEDPDIDDELRTTACILSLWIGCNCVIKGCVQARPWVLQFAKACLQRYPYATWDYPSVDLELNYASAVMFLEDVQPHEAKVAWMLTGQFAELDPPDRKL